MTCSPLRLVALAVDPDPDDAGVIGDSNELAVASRPESLDASAAWRQGTRRERWALEGARTGGWGTGDQRGVVEDATDWPRRTGQDDSEREGPHKRAQRDG